MVYYYPFRKRTSALFIKIFTDHPKYLDEFTYADSDINDIVLSCMNNLSLVGVSGRIFYGGNAAPVDKDIHIERIQGIECVSICEVVECPDYSSRTIVVDLRHRFTVIHMNEMNIFYQ